VSKVLYIIGSLRNPRVNELAVQLREAHPDVEVFDDWFSAGREADDYWKEYEQARGRSYQEALMGYAAKHVFEFDKHHLDRATHVILVLPAGKSGHMEIMYAAYGVGAKTAILLDPEDVRWDVMYQFIPTVLDSLEGVRDWLGEENEERVDTGGSESPERVPDVVWPVGLLSKRPSGGKPSVLSRYATAPSGGKDALGSKQIDRPSEQDSPPLHRRRKTGRQGAEALNDAGVEGAGKSTGRARARLRLASVEGVRE
jgi:hypothetical protein